MDPINGSSSATGVFATGLLNPAVCRMETLTGALAVAAPGDRVVATGATVGNPAQFTATGSPSETFPLNIPNGVSVTTTDSAPNPANYEIHGLVPSMQPGVVTLGDGASLSGFTVMPALGASSTTPLVSCSVGRAVLLSVNVEGTATDGSGTVVVRRGISVISGCALAGVDVTARNAATENYYQSNVGILGAGTSTLTNCTVGAGGGVGIRLEAGSLEVTDGAVQGNAQQGILVGGNTTATTVLVLQNGVVRSNGLSGLEVLSSGGPQLQVAGTQFIDNGRTGTGGSGIAMANASGALTLVSVQAIQNGVAGLDIRGGVVSDLDGVYTANGGLSSTGNGVVATGGTVTLTNTVATGNVGDGFAFGSAGSFTTVTGSDVVASDNNQRGMTANGAVVVDLARAVLQSNAAEGLLLLGGSVTLRGAAVADNGVAPTGPASGIRAPGGTLVLDGTLAGNVLAIRTNGLYGVHLGGAQATVLNGTVETNASDGFMVEPGTGVPMVLQNMEIVSNGGAGILVNRAPVSPGGGSSLTVESCNIWRNRNAGLSTRPTSGAGGQVTMALQQNSIHDNIGSGVVLEQVSSSNPHRVVMIGNDVFANGIVGSSITAGGMWVGVPTNGASMDIIRFYSNRFHSNRGHQVAAERPAGIFLPPTLNLTNSSNACDGTENQYYCYSTARVGLFANNIDVTARTSGWHFGGVSGSDYLTGGFGSVTVAPTCVFVPPACP